MKPLPKRLMAAVVIGFVTGVLWLVCVRFIMYRPDIVHHHANFVLYINGVQDKFDNFTFYEEVQSCNDDEKNNPRVRVHLHENTSHVIHVHDGGSTWSHLFANLGYTLGNDVLKTDKGVFVDGQDGGKLRFYLNGKETDSIANQPIRSEDALLIDFSTDSEAVLKQRYDETKKDAGEYNKKDDPATCSGSKKLTFGQRLRHAVGFSE